MTVERENEKRNEFKDILLSLSKDAKYGNDAHARSDMYKRLESLYYSPNAEDRFRHFYSDIFSVLGMIENNEEFGDLELLLSDLQAIRNGYRSMNSDESGKIIDISDMLKKLYDHCNLDVARISYINGRDRQISGEGSIENINAKISNLQNELETATHEQENVKLELSKQQREYISILGIFAAVVLAFTGGITFSSSVLNNIDTISPYRIVIVSLIIGLVLVNILFGLFYYVDLIVNGHGNTHLSPLILSNVVIIFLIVATIFCWHIGFVEKRNKKFEITLDDSDMKSKTMDETEHDEISTNIIPVEADSSP